MGAKQTISQTFPMTALKELSLGESHNSLINLLKVSIIS